MFKLIIFWFGYLLLSFMFVSIMIQPRNNFMLTVGIIGSIYSLACLILKEIQIQKKLGNFKS